jgi:hypothetical protein
MVKKKGPVFQPFQSKSFYKKFDQKSKTDFFDLFWAAKLNYRRREMARYLPGQGAFNQKRRALTWFVGSSEAKKTFFCVSFFLTIL